MPGLSTPVLLLIFNRPDHAKKVFEAIKKQKPAVLYIAADGPRVDRPEEISNCELAKQIVLDAIDWQCDIKTLFRTENLGCGKAVSEAITWFFNDVEEGIILEDDCLPHSSFFDYCENLLKEYRGDHRIMHIGGNNFQNKNVAGRYSYYYSNQIHVWGWATWRRAWTKYSFNIPTSATVEVQQILKSKFSDIIERRFWERSFDEVANHSVDTWDRQWLYCIYKNNGAGITPNVNLVTNIGFGPDASHTFHIDDPGANVPARPITNIKHPVKFRIEKRADRFTFKKLFAGNNTRLRMLKLKIGKTVPVIKYLYISVRRIFAYLLSNK